MSSTKGAVGLGSIPAASRKVVQSVKEIVNCPEAEIYSMLRECNMDPNEAVSRLLAQDTFREVKSKREKKKESKDTAEYRPRGASNASNYGGRSGTERRAWSTQYNNTESGNMYERPPHRKENGAYSHVAPNSSTPQASNTHVNRHVSALSDSLQKENKLTTPGESFSLPIQTSSGFQSPWAGGNGGQLSMADIVKKGIPQNKAPGPVKSAQYGNHKHAITAPPPVLPQHDHALSGPDHVVGSNQQKDEWPEIEHLPNSAFPSVYAAENLDATSHYVIETSHNIKTNDALLSNDGMEEHNNEIPGAKTASNINLLENDFGDASYYDNNEYEDQSPYHQYEHEEAEDNSTSFSNLASSMQQLSLEKNEQVKEEPRSVVIPDHLLVQTSECLNLSFGSFGPGIAAGLSGTSVAGPLNSDVEQQSEAEDASPGAHSDFRNPEYHGDEQSRSTTPEDLINGNEEINETHTSISPSQPEVLKQDIPSEAEVEQYASHSLARYNFDNSHQQQLQQQQQQQQQHYQQQQQQQLNAAYVQSLMSSQAHNLPPFSNVMAYANVSPGSSLAQQPVSESDLYSQFHANQSMAFGNQGSVGGPSASAAEDLETSNMSSSQQVLPSASVPATGSGLSQHLAMHPYSQPNLPLGPFPNMVSYPFLPQSYAYMPSAFQQTYGGNSSYHQSLAAMLPQYKNNMSVSSLPQQPGAVPTNYGAFGGSSTNVSGNSLNQTAAPGSSAVGYDELMNSHYKGQLLALQQAELKLQHENSAMYAHNNSRTMPTVPANTYYNFQGQNQPAGVFRQNQQQQQQQPSQHFSSPGYPNFYHSQSGMSMEQQNTRDGGAQVQASKQSQQQMWQNGY